MLSQLVLSSLLAGTLAAPFDNIERQSCPDIHVFGARGEFRGPESIILVY